MTIGFYDSGIGGLTILTEVQKLFPNKNFIYLADDQNCPLGEKNYSEIQKATQDGVQNLFEAGADLVILACNTASTTSIRYLQNVWQKTNFSDKKILSIVLPTVEYFGENQIGENHRVGIMATSATIRTQFYQDNFWDKNYNLILDIPMPGLAKAIERGDYKSINQCLEQNFVWVYIELEKLDYIILACTHYPLIQKQIQDFIAQNYSNKKVKLIPQAQQVAQKLQDYIQKHNLDLETGKTQLYCTSGSQDYIQKMHITLQSLL